MTESNKTKVLILEDDRGIAEAAANVLSNAGWTVAFESESGPALARLESPGKLPFALVISGYRIGNLDGISLLTSVSSVSPMTQRMLWIPHDEPDALIEAVNKAGIHACMTYPVDSKNLVAQAEDCLERFRQDIRQSKFKQMIARHNKTIFQRAKNLKKKDQTDRLLLDEKRSKRSRLEFQLRKMTRETDTEHGVSLAALVAEKKIAKDPDSFLALFTAVAGQIKKLMVLLTDSQGGNGWAPRSVGDIIQNDATGFVHPELLDSLIKTAYIAASETPIEKSDTGHTPPASDTVADETDPETETIETYLNLIVDDNGVRAWIKKKKSLSAASFITAQAVSDFLTDQGICYGKVENKVIETWIKSGSDDALAVAKAKLPVPSKDGVITYQFKTEYTNPGEVRDDGSIDFRERGDVPYVESGDLLAEKKPPITGTKGINILGEEIFGREPLDPAFVQGHGTKMSEDGLIMFAETDGQPHLDPLGKITVNPEFVVSGDVDFETGNIDFEGNIVVRGIVKPGFTVSGVNLTADEVEGATISLSGDLNVSSGIRDANIKTVGNIRAKFVHNSTILGFGDFYILKEIIDSDILLSGCCNLEGGHVLGSKITAKRGVLAGKIGTPASSPVELKVGTEKHIVAMLRKNKDRLTDSLEAIEMLREEIRDLQGKDMALENVAAEKAGTQEAYQVRIELLKQKYLEIKDDGDTDAIGRLTRDLKKCFGITKGAARELQEVFERQDRLKCKIRDFEKQINQCEENNMKWVDERRYLKEYAGKGEPDPSVTVFRSIIQRTRIQGRYSRIVIDEDKGPIKIEEIAFEKGNHSYYEMCIRPLI